MQLASRPVISPRFEFLFPSEIRQMSQACQQLGGINLAQGVCDVELPSALSQPAQSAIVSGPNSYVSSRGIPELLQQIALRLNQFGLDFDPETEVLVTSGASAAFCVACNALLSPERR